MSSTTRVLDPTAPLAIEPFDKEWGVGVSGLTEDHFWCNTQAQRFDKLWPVE